ncbi:Tn3 family transposase, partial [Escherichia coli]|uniref:Tn3 family transposase n=1 Tax=Escherichia coli TaxID=562 RepID=UPI000A7C7BCA
GQEDQLGTLGLVTNAVVLWNTIYMQAALDHLRAQGETLNDEDIARLSPLCHGHINTWDLRAPAPTPSHLRATVAIKGSFRGAEF